MIAPPYSAFQLRITGINDCFQWRVSTRTHCELARICIANHFMQQIDTLGKIQSTSQQIASRLSRVCDQCMIDSTYITAAAFSCDPQETTHVIYRARLSSTRDVSSTDMITLLQEWVSSGNALVTLDHIQLNLDPTCSVMIVSLSDPICPVPVTTPDTGTATIGVGESDSNNLLTPVIFAILVVLVALVVVFLAAIIFMRRRSLRWYIAT